MTCHHWTMTREMRQWRNGRSALRIEQMAPISASGGFEAADLSIARPFERRRRAACDREPSRKAAARA